MVAGMPHIRPTTSMRAHMKGMVMRGMLVGLQTRFRSSERSPELDFASQEPLRRHASIAQKRYVSAFVRVYGIATPMCEHPRAQTTLLGGNTPAQSQCCGPQPTP